ncbi:MAG: oligoendopeptidase F, partial [Actinobacteria bacterium]|nr:oligoendopeptidase F [Actinomycetota bacterium]
MPETPALPRWSVADVHESFDSRSFMDAMERLGADVGRLTSLFDEHDVRGTEPRKPTAQDGDAADAVIRAFNSVAEANNILGAYVYATVSTDSRNEKAQGLLSELEVMDSKLSPLVARLAEWVASLGADELSQVSDQAREHLGPLRRLQARAEHQMSEPEENLYSELSTTGSSAWGRLQGDVTSQLKTRVELPDGAKDLPMAAVRGLASNPDVRVRKAAYEAEMRAWPTIGVSCAAAMNAIKGEANTVNRRREWASPLDASLYANSVSRATFDA